MRIIFFYLFFGLYNSCDLAAKFKAVFDGNFEEVDYVAQMPYESVDALVDSGSSTTDSSTEGSTTS